MLLKRLLILTAGSAILASGATPVQAKSRVIGQITSPKNHASVILARGLLPTQRYRIQIVAPARVKFSGIASEQFTYLLHKNLGTYHMSMTLKGAGSRSFSITIPKILRKARVTSWILSADAGSPARHVTIQMRFVQV